MIKKWLALALGLAFLLLSCSENNPPTPPPIPTVVPGQITVIEATAPEAPAGMVNGAVYLTLQNGTDQPVHLLSATTAVAAQLSFHETTDDNGIIRMRPQPDGFVVGPGESLVLAQAGKHLMLENLVAPLVAGAQFTLTLVFADADPMTILIPVSTRGEVPMDHSKMDHNK